MKNHYSRLVDRITAAGWAPEKWEDFINDLSYVFGDALVQLHISEPLTNNKPFIIDKGADEQALRTFENHFKKLNPYPEMVLKRNFIGRVAAASRFIPVNIGQKMDFYNEWMKPNGWSLDHIGVALFNTETSIAILSMSPQIARPQDNLEENIANLQTLVAPLQKALQLNRLAAKANGSGRALEFAIDQIDDAVFLLDEQGKVVLRNRKSKVVTDIDGVLGIDLNGRLYSPDTTSHNNLQEVVTASEMSNVHGGSISNWVNLTPHAESEHYIIRVARYADHPSLSSAPPPSDILHALYPNRLKMLIVKKLTRAINVSPDVLQNILGLTPAEAKLAAALAAGKSQGEYAEEAGIKTGTTRDHAKSIYSKLRVRGHPQLLLYISSLRDLGLIE